MAARERIHIHAMKLVLWGRKSYQQFILPSTQRLSWCMTNHPCIHVARASCTPALPEQYQELVRTLVRSPTSQPEIDGKLACFTQRLQQWHCTLMTRDSWTCIPDVLDAFPHRLGCFFPKQLTVCMESRIWGAWESSAVEGYLPRKRLAERLALISSVDMVSIWWQQNIATAPFWTTPWNSHQICHCWTYASERCGRCFAVVSPWTVWHAYMQLYIVAAKLLLWDLMILRKKLFGNLVLFRVAPQVQHVSPTQIK